MHSSLQCVRNFHGNFRRIERSTFNGAFNNSEQQNYKCANSKLPDDKEINRWEKVACGLGFHFLGTANLPLPSADRDENPVSLKTSAIWNSRIVLRLDSGGPA